ncbi:MAG: tetratricopeptide repeat protein [Bryobacterales bacterium]|nr:tetratricopeptide repeat protein [Bryobacterales bacterium]
MARRIKKYNPGFLTDQELVDSFCVRTGEFALLAEAVRESTGNSNPHAIVIGPRGSGKTTLLLRVAAEVRRDPALRAAWFPVVFAEETYEVSTCGEFWLQCLFNLADQAPHGESGLDLHRAYEELQKIQDDRMLADLCLAAVLEFADSQSKRLVVIVENLNTMFHDIGEPEVGWQLRKTLQCEPRIFLLGSATSRFREIDDSSRALYDLFQVHTLKRLDSESCVKLWRSVSDRDIGKRAVRPLEILTGGNPRLLAIVSEFGSGLSFLELMDDLLDLVDDHTEYFRSHLEALGPQERRVYLALATLWKPATAREVSLRARLSTSHCSALLKRLVGRGAVVNSGGTPRRREYYVAERMYNIYYLLRRGRGTSQIVEALVRFMSSFYSDSELRTLAQRITGEAISAEGKQREMIEQAIQSLPAALRSADRIRGLPATFAAGGTGIEDAVTGIPQSQGEPEQALSGHLARAGRLLAETERLIENRNYDQAITVCNKIESLLAGLGTLAAAWLLAIALSAKSVALARAGHLEEAIDVCDEVLKRTDSSDAPGILGTVAEVLANKVALLCRLNRAEEIVASCTTFEDRFGSIDSPATDQERIRVLFNKAVALEELGRAQEAKGAFERLIQRFGSSDDQGLQEPVAWALLEKAGLLEEEERLEEACVTYDAVIERFGEDSSPLVADAVVSANLRKGRVLAVRGQFPDALECFGAAVHRSGSQESPETASKLAVALISRGAMLDQLGRPREAQESYAAVIRRFSPDDSLALEAHVASAYARRTVSLLRRNRLDDAFASVEEFRDRMGASQSPSVLRWLGVALLQRAKAELRAGHPKAAIATAGVVLEELSSNPADNLVLARLLRAESHFVCRNQSGCESDLQEMLRLLQSLETVPPMSIEGLMTFTARFGPERILNLIESSSMVNRLLPLVTALREELGIETRVPQEVAEVARDIRSGLEGWRQAGAP